MGPNFNFVWGLLELLNSSRAAKMVRNYVRKTDKGTVQNNLQGKIKYLKGKINQFRGTIYPVRREKMPSDLMLC